VQLLLAKLRDGRQPPITRCAAAAYLASYLARCGRLPTPTVLAALQQLADCCSSYASSAAQLQRSASSGGVGAAEGDDVVQRHQVFYAMVQGLLYVLCYHMGGCIAGGGLRKLLWSACSPRRSCGCRAAAARRRVAAPLGCRCTRAAAGVWLVQLRLVRPGPWPPVLAPPAGPGADQLPLPPPDAGTGAPEAQAVLHLVREQLLPLLTHWLSPLRACLPSVASEFSHQAAALGLMDCSSLLQQVSP
jgi:hypothetical protein